MKPASRNGQFVAHANASNTCDVLYPRAMRTWCCDCNTLPSFVSFGEKGNPKAATVLHVQTTRPPSLDWNPMPQLENIAFCAPYTILKVLSTERCWNADILDLDFSVCNGLQSLSVIVMLEVTFNFGCNEVIFLTLLSTWGDCGRTNSWGFASWHPLPSRLALALVSSCNQVHSSA